VQTSGHLALVTGGGSGIGLAIARTLARAGNAVIISGRDAGRLEAAARQLPNAHAVPFDVSDTARLPEILDRIGERFGPVSLLVNNAGVFLPYRFDAPDVGPKVAEEVLTNVLGTFELTRLALPQLRAHREAGIVTLSSILTYVASPRVPVYAATKAALHSFSRSLRGALADTPVRVFDVLPPLVDTEPVRHLNGAKITPAQVAEEVLAGIAADRYEINVGRTALVKRLSRISPALADRVVSRRLGAPTGPTPVPAR
jgi:uncharacterized oxidoreductase